MYKEMFCSSGIQLFLQLHTFSHNNFNCMWHLAAGKINAWLVRFSDSFPSLINHIENISEVLNLWKSKNCGC